MENQSRISFKKYADSNIITDLLKNTPENYGKQQMQMKEAILDKQENEINDIEKQLEEYKHAHTQKVKEYHIGRNDKCPCGSGKKYKNCCLDSGKYENLIEKKS